MESTTNQTTEPNSNEQYSKEIESMIDIFEHSKSGLIDE